MDSLLQLLQDNLVVVIPAGIGVLADAALGWVKKEKTKWPGITLIIGRLVCTGLAKMFNALADAFDTAIER